MKCATLLKRRVAMQLGICLALGIGLAMLGFTFGRGSGYEQGFASGYQQGGESGFEDGFAEASMSCFAIAAADAVRVSTLVREENHQQAIASLERTVDDSLIVFSGFASRDQSPFGDVSLREKSRRIMKRVATHRATYPTTVQYPFVREAIDDTLASFAHGTN